MYAYFAPGGGLWPRYYLEQVLGMPLLRVELPRRLSPGQCRKIERRLRRFRVHQTLNHPQTWRGPALPAQNATRELWLEVAPELALRALMARNIDPRYASVELVAEHWSAPAEQILLSLIPRVRRIVLSVPVPEGLLWHLQREAGFSPGVGQGDVALCLSPTVRKNAIPLWPSRPAVPGFSLSTARPTGAEDCPVEPLLAALRQSGRLGREDIILCADGAHFT